MPKTFTPRSATFWISTDALISSQPSLSQFIHAATKKQNPVPVVFGDRVDVNMQAAMIARMAARARGAKSGFKMALPKMALPERDRYVGEFRTRSEADSFRIKLLIVDPSYVPERCQVSAPALPPRDERTKPYAVDDWHLDQPRAKLVSTYSRRNADSALCEILQQRDAVSDGSNF